MNLLPVILGGLVLVAAASSKKKATVAPPPTPTPTKPTGGGGGGVKPKPKDDGSDATFVSPSTPCDFVMVRTVNDVSFQPTGPTKIQLGPFAYGDKAVVLAEATAKAKTAADPYPGSPPGAWVLLAQCEGGFSETTIVRTFS